MKRQSMIGVVLACAVLAGGLYARTVDVAKVENGVATLAFNAADDKGYTLVMASDEVDRGADFDAWRTTCILGTVAADETTREVPLGEANDCVRFFLREDDTSLPYAKRLLYVESNGSQYVDTGINGRSGVGVVFDMSWLAVEDRTAVGSRSGGSRFFPIHSWPSSGEGNERYRWCLGYGGFVYGNSYMKDGMSICYHVESKLAENDVVVTIDKVAFSAWSGLNANQSVDTGRPMYIFAANYDGAAKQFASMRLFRGKILFNDELQRDFVPCELANGEGALYDQVTKQIFQARGGALVKGPEADFPQVTAASSATVRPHLDARLVARWTFDNYDPADPTSPNVLQASVGSDAIPCYFEGAGTAPIANGNLGGMHVVTNGLAAGEYALAIPRYHHLKLPLPEGVLENCSWSMKIRFMAPEESCGRWRVLYSRNLANTGDGDLFISPNEQLGMNGRGWNNSYGSTVSSNVWHTITVSGSDHRRDIFLDGTTQALWANDDGSQFFNGLDAILLCADDTEAEGALLYIDSVEIWKTGGALEGRLPHYTRAGMTGEWTFPAADPLAATKGRRLEYEVRRLPYAYTVRTDGVAEGDTGLCCGNQCGLKCYHGLPYHSNYTVVMDVRMPADAELNKLHVMFNPVRSMSYDGLSYLKCVGPDDVRLWLASGTWTDFPVCRAGEWIRFVMTYIDGGDRVDYVNGAKIDARPNSNMRVVTDYFHFLVENNNEDYPLDISYAAIYDRALTEVEVAELHSHPAAHDAYGRTLNYLEPAGLWEGSPMKTVKGERLIRQDYAYVWTRGDAPASATYVFDFSTLGNFNGAMLTLNANGYGTGCAASGDFVTTTPEGLASPYSGTSSPWGYWTYDKLLFGERHRVAVSVSAAGHVLYYIDGEPMAQLMPYNAGVNALPTATMKFFDGAGCKVTRIAAYDTVLTPAEIKALGGPGEVIPSNMTIFFR